MMRPAEPYPETAGVVAPRVQQALAALIGLAGVGLIIVSFLQWGRARAVVNGIGALVSATASFPGLGDPTVTATYSDETFAGKMNFETPLHNSNPGWVALVCGILAIVAGIAYLRLRQWRVVTIAVAVLGLIAGLTCVTYMVDVRGAFNDPANWADANFSPGVGLIAAFGLSLVLIALGVAAFVLEWRATPKTSGY
jgi:cobalamin synthase